MSYQKAMANATKVVKVESTTFTPIAQEVLDIKALGAGNITVVANGNPSVTIPVLSGEYLNLRGAVAVTASDVDYLVYS